MARKAKIKVPGSDTTPDRRNDAFPSESLGGGVQGRSRSAPERVPVQAGQSGNPKGRKRKAPSLLPDLKQLFESAFNQKVTVTQGERQRLLTMWDAGMQQLAVQFAKGDRHARRDVFWIAERLGSESLTSKKGLDGVLAAERQAILDAYVARQTQNASSAPSPLLAPSELLDDDAPDQPEEK